LGVEERARAPVLYRGLQEALKAFEGGERRSGMLIEEARKVIREVPGVEVQYVAVSDALSLEDVDVVGEVGAIMSGAVKVGKTRIIDNVLLGVDPKSWRC
jgi:pantoate--beta-alanine ligase